MIEDGPRERSPGNAAGHGAGNSAGHGSGHGHGARRTEPPAGPGGGARVA